MNAHRSSAFFAAIEHKLRGLRATDPRDRKNCLRAAQLWQRVARIERRLGHGISTADWMKVPAMIPR